MSSGPRVLIVGYFGFGNLGDEAILGAMLSDLRELEPALGPTVVGGDSRWLAATYGVCAVHWRDSLGIAEAVRQADAVLIGGGGILQDYWGVDPESLLTPAQAGLTYYLAPAAVAAAHGVPVMLYAVGAGPLVSAHAQRLVRAACELAQVVTVRDEGSRDLLGRIGIGDQRVRVTADPAFGVTPAGADTVDALLAPLRLPAERPLLGVQLRHWDIGVGPAFWEREVAETLDMFVTRHDASVLFLPFQRRLGEREGDADAVSSSDPAVIDRVRSLMGRANRTFVVEAELTPSAAAGVLGRCEAVLAMRLHGMLLAALSGVPAVSLSYDPKVSAAADRLGIAGLSYELASIDRFTLAAALQRALEGRTALAQSVRVRCAELRGAARENAAAALSLAREGRRRTSAVPSLHGDLLAAQLREQRRLRAENAEHLRTVARLEEEAAAMRASLAASEREAAQGREEVARLDGRLRESVADGRHLASERDSLASERDSLAVELSAQERRLASALADVEKRQEEINRTQELLARQRQLEGSLRGEIERLRGVEHELYRFQTSRLWRLGSLYWKLLERLGRLPKGGASPSRPEPASEPAPIATDTGPGGETSAEPTAERKQVSIAADRQALVAPILERVAGARGVVVFLPSVGWGIYLFQRPHHLARTFARLGWVAIFDSSNASYDRVTGFKELEPNLFLYSGPEEVLHLLPRPLLWSFTYNFDHKDRYPRDAPVVYDWIDDLEVFPQDPALLRRHHERALGEADLVASVARRLHEQALRQRPDALYLPNGVEYERFAEEAVEVPKDPALRGLLGRGAPVLGYYGALAAWFDYALLNAVASEREDWSFLLIGPRYDDSVDGQPLFERANVAWLGPRDYPSLPGYLRCFDVASIPFQINDITRATSPLKLFEYFAGGKAVITTPMPECQAFPEVRIAASAQEFAAQLDGARAATADPLFRTRLREIARANSWEERVRTVMRHLEAKGLAVTGAAARTS